MLRSGPRPLQNRVTSFGAIVAVPQRGMFTGNRGIIHDPATKTLLRRRWTSKAWLICACTFRDRRRDVMATRSWTELFFLDEATALAAGHRPCFFCRRKQADAFRSAWQTGNRIAVGRVKAIDAILHAERLSDGTKRVHPLPPTPLPDGAMVAHEETAYLIFRGQALRWTFDGYEGGEAVPPAAVLITPPSTVKALTAGYRPVIHPSAAHALSKMA